MADLIDRQAAIKAVETALDRETILNSFVRKVAVSAVKNTPSAQPQHEVRFSDADHVWIDGKQYISLQRFGEAVKDAQPEIIHCKDCKHWMRAYLDISGKFGCNVMRDYTAPNDYCYKAERKE